jgi:hypothetical protein
MQAHIFAEGSNTTAENRDQAVIEYYQGLFSMVAGLSDEISGLAETRLHVLSEEYGVIEGDEIMATIHQKEDRPVGNDVMAEQAKSELLDSSAEADVMVILLSTGVFEKTVAEVWDDLVDAAKPESIWCISAARSSLDGLNFEGLEAKDCTVLTYQRVGVARIGSETRDALLERVEQKANQ